jgi:hypothetical protein
MIHSVGNITDWVSGCQTPLENRLTLLRVPEQDANGEYLRLRDSNKRIGKTALEETS